MRQPPGIAWGTRARRSSAASTGGCSGRRRAPRSASCATTCGAEGVACTVLAWIRRMTAQPLPASGSQRRRAARDEPASGKTLLVYTLHCGNLYGTERMALTTLASLRELGSPLVLSPEGPVREEAGRMGIVSRPFRGRAGLFAALARALLTHRRVVVFTTSIQHSWMCSLLAGVLRNRLAHLHVVHGGAPDEAGSYGHKRLLNPLDVRLVVVSEFGRERLLEHGVRGDKISVIGNFLTDRRIAECPRR